MCSRCRLKRSPGLCVCVWVCVCVWGGGGQGLQCKQQVALIKHWPCNRGASPDPLLASPLWLSAVSLPLPLLPRFQRTQLLQPAVPRTWPTWLAAVFLLAALPCWMAATCQCHHMAPERLRDPIWTGPSPAGRARTGAAPATWNITWTAAYLPKLPNEDR